MRIILKILAMPFVVILTIFGAVFTFVHFLSAWVFYVAAFVLGALSLVMLFSGDTYFGIGNFNRICYIYSSHSGGVDCRQTG